jgi:hypothetical protein
MAAAPDGIWRVETPGAGAGAFIAFRKFQGEIYWIRSGDEYQALVNGGNQVFQADGEQQIRDVFAQAKPIGAAPPAGFLSGSSYQAFVGRLAGASNPSAPAPQAPPQAPPQGPPQAPPQTPASPPVPSPAPEPDPGPQFDVEAYYLQIQTTFPWLSEVGLGLEWFRDVVSQATTPDYILARLRQTDQYKQRFVGLRRQDGTLRMNEAEYLNTEAAYRQLLQQYGFNLANYQRPQDLGSFFQADLDPNELRDRLDVYRNLETGSQNVRDAFFVYAGLDVSVDDLYSATVNPAVRDELMRTYSERIASSDFDYQKFMDRATELGLQRLANDLNELSAAGSVTSDQVQRILRTQPAQARQVMDVLYTGGQGAQASSFMGLQELLDAFEYAALGAVATGTGLDLPGIDRIREIRESGVNRQQLLSGYQDFARRGGQLSAALQRVQAGQKVTQSMFEEGAFLGQAQQSTRLGQAFEAESAAGRAGGGFRFDQNRAGDLFQRGLNV